MIMSRKLTINFLSTGHDVKDDLIFYRYASTFSSYGHEVRIFAKSIDKFKVLGGIQCFGAISPNWGRFRRFTIGNIKLLFYTLKKRSDLNIICTPDLLPVGFILKYFFNKVVIYNAQENYSVKFLDREWIPPFLAKFFSKLERILANKMSGIIVTDSISFKNYNAEKTIILPNFPLIDSAGYVEKIRSAWQKKVNDNHLNLVYIGGISKSRGFDIFVRLNRLLPNNVSIHLWGRFANENNRKVIPQSGKIIYHGFKDHKEISKELLKYDAGLCIFENVPAYYYSSENTTKLFEYMKAGIPVIASDFPGLKRIIEDCQCGFLVDPSDIKETVNLLVYLLKNKKVLEKSGMNGYFAFRKKYNWERYKMKLINFVLEKVN